ncbi:MAG: hypothetical protein H0T79_07705, partial [Deltaproteobacteria bacterium]|nr:hypothetical protein [Deltaproteobacteria bacterium]
YQSLRLGARVSAALGSVEPYLAVENRIVFDGGALQTRFDSASASGLHGAIGVAARMGALSARVEGALTQYSWTFTYGSGDMRQASGGSDRISQVSVSLGYAY